MRVRRCCCAACFAATYPSVPNGVTRTRKPDDRGETPSLRLWLRSAAQVSDVCRFLTRCIPDAGFAVVELDARVLAECPFYKRPAIDGVDNLNVVKVRETSLGFTQLLVNSGVERWRKARA